MKPKVYKKRRKICNMVKNITLCLILLSILDLTGIAGCIEREHYTLVAGVVEMAKTTMFMFAAYFGYCLANYIGHAKK